MSSTSSPEWELRRAVAGAQGETLTALLARMLAERFGLPEEDAGRIVQQARVALLTAAEVSDPAGGMVGMACELARGYWRREPPPDATLAEAAALRRLQFTGPALARLAPQAREAVRLRFHEGRTYDQIAAELGLARTCARRLVTLALARMGRPGRR